MSMAERQSSGELPIDVETLRAEIRRTYAEVSADQGKDFVFPTGRAWAEELGYPQHELARVPDAAPRSHYERSDPWPGTAR